MNRKESDWTNMFKLKLPNFRQNDKKKALLKEAVTGEGAW